MLSRRASPRDPLELRLERALQPGEFIGYGAVATFVAGLEQSTAELAGLTAAEATRALALVELLLAGCYEKAHEIDDSGGHFGTFVQHLFGEWVRVRQAAASDPDGTARFLLARIADDDQGFTSRFETTIVRAMDEPTLDAFERQTRVHFESATRLDTPATDGRATYARRRWSEVLRAVYVRRGDAVAYIELCEATQCETSDCLAIARMLAERGEPEHALAWCDRGAALEAGRIVGSFASIDLVTLRRDLLVRLGRAQEAFDDAWREFERSPGSETYAELERLHPTGAGGEWHERAMEFVDRAVAGEAPFPRASASAVLALWVETHETDRLVTWLRTVSDSALRALSPGCAEAVIEYVGVAHPDLAARVCYGLAIDILEGKRSRRYEVALGYLDGARRYYEAAGLLAVWNDLAAAILSGHRRKQSFMHGFRRLLAGEGAPEPVSFLQRARRRWS